MNLRLSTRAQRIAPFYVMEVAKAARAHAANPAHASRPMVYLNIGEPDFTAPELVQTAACTAIAQGQSQYTDATGLPALRQAISGWYASRFGLHIDAERIIVTAGASAALQLACLALIDPGDEVLMPDPCYPCNRQFVTAAGGQARLLRSEAAQRFQLDDAMVQAAWGTHTRGVLLATPSNPTGTSIAPDVLARIIAAVRARGGVTLVDEIYLGLSFEPHLGQSALALGEDVISINSFSKYFNMTGWRLGWLVVPPALVAPIERLAQNLYICPSTIAQHAALACFAPASLAEYERRRAAFKARRDALLPALPELGLPVPVAPDGAFYLWADCRQACQRLGVADSWALTFALIERAGVALTPGRDFGDAHAAHYVRLSTANSMDQLHTALARLRGVLC